MQHLFAQIEAAKTAIRHSWNESARVGVVLGTGMNNIVSSLGLDVVIPYDQIPHFPASTAIGHSGNLHCGQFRGVNVIAMQGRTHLYEGVSLSDVTLPIRLMKAMGVDLLILTNASGGVNPHFGLGDVMVLEDHIDLLPDNPLRGVNDDRLGPRFPDMSQPYDPTLIDRALEIARDHQFAAHKGVYAAMAGPNYETRAEYRLMRYIGADVVGMSTVPEVIVAVHSGMRSLGLSTITNICNPDRLEATSGETVVAMAAAAEEKVKAIICGILEAEGSER